MQQSIIFLIIIFFSNLIGMYFRMYSIWWFDVLHHLLGGFFMAMLITHYLKIKELRISNYELGSLKKCLIIIGAVSFIGIMWEFAEYLANQILIEPIYNKFGIRTYFVGDLDDTMNDLLMDILGAFSFSVFWLKIKIKSGLN